MDGISHEELLDELSNLALGLVVEAERGCVVLLLLLHDRVRDLPAQMLEVILAPGDTSRSISATHSGDATPVWPFLRSIVSRHLFSVLDRPSRAVTGKRRVGKDAPDLLVPQVL